jgi:hypothetical protein
MASSLALAAECGCLLALVVSGSDRRLRFKKRTSLHHSRRNERKMTYVIQLLASLRALAGFAPADESSANDAAKAAAAQSVLVAASRSPAAHRVTAN